MMKYTLLQIRFKSQLAIVVEITTQSQYIGIVILCFLHSQ